MKEARALFWPWCLVMLGGALAWISVPLDTEVNLNFTERSMILLTDFLSFAATMGFWLGMPLLATLSLGNEFQHRTFAGLLSQPEDRMKIWAEKWIVMAAAVGSAALVYGFGPQRFLRPFGDSVFAMAWIIISIGSAAFWTLLARSTIGGFIFNLCQLLLIVAGEVVMLRFLATVPSGELSRTGAVYRALSTGTLIAAIGYGLTMLWLGRRKLARFQVTGGDAGDVALTAVPHSLRKPFASFLRCRPQGAALNLIRKELRLLWPFWALTLLTFLGLVCLSLTKFWSIAASKWGSSVAAGLVFLYAVIGAILAGSLSMGEERGWGTLSWHMTLPLSSTRLWLTKAGVAVFSSIIGCMAILMVGRWMLGWNFMNSMNPGFDRTSLVFWNGIVAILCFGAFCCGCAVKGTVRAVLWVGPALGAILFAGSIGSIWLIGWTETSGLLTLILSKMHPFPFPLSIADFLTNHALYNEQSLLWRITPVVLLAIIQSCRLFRAEVQESSRALIRCILPLAVVSCVSNYAISMPYVLVGWSYGQTRVVVQETHAAVGKMHLDPGTLDPGHPRQITIEDLGRVSPLSEVSRAWLVNSTITVAPKTENKTWLVVHKGYSDYTTTIHLSNNWVCTAYGAIYHYCKSPDSQWGTVTPPELNFHPQEAKP